MIVSLVSRSGKGRVIHVLGTDLVIKISSLDTAAP
jgi:hypothetical protein